MLHNKSGPVWRNTALGAKGHLGLVAHDEGHFSVHTGRTQIASAGQGIALDNRIST